MDFMSNIQKKFTAILGKARITRTSGREAQLSFGETDSIDSFGHIAQPYGYHSRPEGGETATVVSAGNRQASVVIGIEGPKTPSSLGPGDVFLVNSKESSISLKRREIALKAKSFSFQGDQCELLSVLVELLDTLSGIQVPTPAGPVPLGILPSDPSMSAGPTLAPIKIKLNSLKS